MTVRVRFPSPTGYLHVGGLDMHDWFERYVGGTEDMDYDEALAWAGLKLVRADSAQWRIEEMPDATPQQLRVRSGWLSGLAR